jgi:DNA anti-recombination protein RmuC
MQREQRGTSLREIGWRTVGAELLRVAFLGCGTSNEPANTSDVKQHAGGAGDRVASHGATQGRELGQRARQALDEMDRALKGAHNRLSDLPETARQRLDAAIDHSQRARDSVAKELAELTSSGAERWESTRQRMSDALDEMAKALLEIRVSQSEG